MRHRLRYDLTRFFWLVDRFATPLAVDVLESAMPGFDTADMVKPSPTNCAVLEAGVTWFDGPSFVDQYLTRCKELSKLLFNQD